MSRLAMEQVILGLEGMNVWFCRHGEKQFDSLTNEWSLTEKGHRQAIKAGKEMKEKELNFKVMVSSPMKRTMQTTEGIRKNISVDIIRYHDLHEISKADNPEENHQRHYHDPMILEELSDETFEEIMARAEDVLRFVHSLGIRNTLLVGHWFIGAVIFARYAGITTTQEFWKWRKMDYYNPEYCDFLRLEKLPL